MRNGRRSTVVQRRAEICAWIMDSKRYFQTLTALIFVMFLSACSSGEDPLALTSAGNANSNQTEHTNTPVSAPDNGQGTTAPETPSTPSQGTGNGSTTPSGSFQNPTVPTVPATPETPVTPSEPETPPSTDQGSVTPPDSTTNPDTPTEPDPGTNPDTSVPVTDTPTTPSEPTLFSISAQPQSQVVSVGRSVTFNVQVNSTYSPNFQWYFNGSPIEGATHAYYAIAQVTEEKAGNYQVKVTVAKQQSLSQIATLTVNNDTSATISWNRPSKRENGQTLERTDIKTYRIYHTSSSQQDAVYEIDGTKTTFTIDQLSSGDHSFAITTVDTGDQESDLSIVVTKTIL